MAERNNFMDRGHFANTADAEDHVGEHADRRVRASETRLRAHCLRFGIGDVPGGTSSRRRIVCFDGVSVSGLTPPKFCKLIALRIRKILGRASISLTKLSLDRGFAFHSRAEKTLGLIPLPSGCRVGCKASTTEPKSDPPTVRRSTSLRAVSVPRAIEPKMKASLTSRASGASVPRHRVRHPCDLAHVQLPFGVQQQRQDLPPIGSREQQR